MGKASFGDLPPEERLLLLCARPVLDASGEQALAGLLGIEIDWARVLEAARTHYIEPLLARHVLGHGRPGLPDRVRSALQARRREIAMESLQIVAAQQQLVQRVLAPLRVSHAFIKGPALAQAYYGDVAWRRCRDIDVLIEPARIAEVGEALAASGHEITNAAWTTFRQRRLAAFSRYCSALEMRSPMGVLVELHRTADSTGCIFSSHELLARAVHVDDAKFGWRMLAPDDMFVYVCYHHARHAWGSLHWCADLDAMTRHASFDLAAVRARARAHALEATVEEALRLNEDLLCLATGRNLPAGRPPSRFLEDCAAALAASLRPAPTEAPREAATVTPVEQHHAEREPDFQYDWQSSPRYRRRFELLRWKPTANDVNAWPLPLALHWAYYFIRPVRIALARVRALARVGHGAASEGR